MWILVLHKQTHSKAILGFTASNTQKVAKLIIRVAPPFFLNEKENELLVENSDKNAETSWQTVVIF